MARKAGETVATAVTEKQVLEFLRDNPEFLARHPDLLLQVAPLSRYDDPVVDLQYHMIRRAREKLDEMKGATEHLISTARSNISTQTRTHQAILAVLNAAGMPELAHVVGDELPPLLDVDVATLCFEMDDRAQPELAAIGIQRLPARSVERLLGDKPVLLLPRRAGDPAVFGEGAGLVNSAALVRLDAGPNCPPGLLALGVRAEKGFHPQQGTELLTFLAQVVEHGVRRWVSHGGNSRQG